jgi:hypothetical protein
LLSEHVNYTHIIIKKLIENDVFVETPWNKKDCWDIYRGIFKFFYKYFAEAI